MQYISCPECNEHISVENVAEIAEENAKYDGADSYGTDEVECASCGALLEVTLSCEISYRFDLYEIETISLGTKPDGRYEIDGEIFIYENGEIIERYMLPDENQMSLDI